MYGVSLQSDFAETVQISNKHSFDDNMIYEMNGVLDIADRMYVSVSIVGVHLCLNSRNHSCKCHGLRFGENFQFTVNI